MNSNLLHRSLPLHIVYTSNANEVARSYSVLSNLRIMAIAFIINLPGNLLLIPGYNIGI